MEKTNGNGRKQPRRIPVNDADATERDRRDLPALPEGESDDLPEGGAPVNADGPSKNPEPAVVRNGEQAGGPAEITADGAMDSAALQARVAELEDRWKRAAADLDNFRKRFDRELERLRCQERETIFREWLAVVDNMERALCSEGASSNPWYEGMEAIHQQMLSVMAKFGVKPFVPMGEKFDPRLHEAVATASLPDQPEGKIVEVVQTGYLIDDKVLRPAKVIAVKHG